VVNAVATDAVGNVSPQGSTTIDASAPAAPVIDPSNGAALHGTAEAGSTVTLTGAGGAPIGQATTDPSGHWTFTPSSPIPDGTVVNAVATDAAGNASPQATATVDALAPAPPVIDPSNGAALAGTAEAGSTVTLTGPGGAPIGQVTADPSGHWTFTPASPLPDGTVVNAVATDAVGNASPQGSATIDALAPAAPANLVVAADGSSLTGTAEAGSTVQVVVNGDTAHPLTTTADGSGNFTVVFPAPLVAGEPLSVTAADAAHNVSPPGTANAPDLSPPAVTVAEAGDGYVNAAEVGNGIQVHVALTTGAVAGDVINVHFTGPGGYAADQAYTITAADRLAGGADITLTPVGMPEGASAITADINGGNASTAVNFTVDTIPPALPVLNLVANILTISGDPGAILTVAVNVGGVSATVTVTADNTGHASVDLLTGLDIGLSWEQLLSAQVSVTGADVAGNTTNAVTLGIDAGLLQPITIGDFAVNVAVLPVPTFGFSAHTEPGSTIRLEIVTPLANVTVNPVVDASGNFTLNLLDPALLTQLGISATDLLNLGPQLSFNIIATDAAGHDGAVYGIGFTGAGVSLALGDVTISGGLGVDVLSGVDGLAEHLQAGLGADLILHVGAGDIVTAGDGADLVQLTAANFGSVDGGVGFDTLLLAGGVDIDYGAVGVGTLTNIERINLGVGDTGSALTLTGAEVTAITGGGNVLQITGEPNDSLIIAGAIDTGTTQTIGGVVYDVFTLGAATLLVQVNTVQVQIPPGLTIAEAGDGFVSAADVGDGVQVNVGLTAGAVAGDVINLHFSGPGGFGADQAYTITAADRLAGSANITLAQPPGMPEGASSITANINGGAASVVNFIVDTLAPIAPVLDLVGNILTITGEAGASLTVAVNVGGVNATATVTADATGHASLDLLAGLDLGLSWEQLLSAQVSVTGTDGAGNTSNIVTLGVDANVLAPITVGNFGLNVALLPPTFGFSATTEIGSTIRLEIVTPLVNVTVTPPVDAAGNFTLNLLDPALLTQLGISATDLLNLGPNLSFNVIVTDANGNDSGTYGVSFTGAGLSLAFGDITVNGGVGADALSGVDGRIEHILAGLGDDLVLHVGAGDIVNAGDGADLIQLTANGFGSVDGGVGFDTLLLAGGIDIDYGAVGVGTLTNIERIDLGTGDAGSALTLTGADVTAITGGGNVLQITGESTDTLTIAGAVDTGTTQTIGGVVYNVFTLDAATLLVEVNTVQVLAPPAAPAFAIAEAADGFVSAADVGDGVQVNVGLAAGVVAGDVINLHFAGLGGFGADQAYTVTAADKLAGSASITLTQPPGMPEGAASITANINGGAASVVNFVVDTLGPALPVLDLAGNLLAITGDPGGELTVAVTVGGVTANATVTADATGHASVDLLAGLNLGLSWDQLLSAQISVTGKDLAGNLSAAASLGVGVGALQPVTIGGFALNVNVLPPTFGFSANTEVGSHIRLEVVTPLATVVLNPLVDASGNFGLNLLDPTLLSQLGLSVTQILNLGPQLSFNIIATDSQGHDSASYGIGFTGTGISLAFGDVTVLGGIGPDVLSGVDGRVEHINSGLGADLILHVGTGDIVNAGDGNDLIQLTAANFGSVDGGTGFDTLLLANGIDIDYGAAGIGTLTNIDRIDLGTGDSGSVLTLTSAEVNAITDSAHVLQITGEANDTLNITGATDTGTTQTIGGIVYDVYTFGTASVLVEDNTVQVVH
jgi:hypothetical protein